MAFIGILDVVHRQRLEAAPTKGEHQRVVALQQSREPTMLLEAAPQQGEAVLV